MAILACQLLSGAAQSGSGASDVARKGDSVVEAAERHPNDVRLATAAGEFYFHRERWKQSVHWLSKAYMLSGGDEQVGYDLAFAQMQSGDLTGATQQLSAMETKSDTARVHSLLGEVEEQEGKSSDAAHEYYRAAEIDPSESSIFDLANFLLQHKQYVGYLAESVKFFRYGTSKFPKSSKMLVGLGVALYASQEYDEAVRTLCAAVDLDPSDQRPVTFLGMARKVSPELAAQVDQRLQDFATRYPENAAASYEYAMSLWDRGGGEQGRNLAEIEALLKRATARAPRWYEPHYQLAMVYESENRSRDAIGELRQAATLQPDFKPAHFELARMYKRVGDNVHAAQEADRAKQLDNVQIKSELLQPK
jgi:tetratricopeptide (TPR) repeat protein